VIVVSAVGIKFGHNYPTGTKIAGNPKQGIQGYEKTQKIFETEGAHGHYDDDFVRHCPDQLVHNHQYR